jgi:hypothetical protein
VYNLSHNWVDVLIFYIWPYATSQWIQQRNSIKFCATLGKSVMETPVMIRQKFGEESMSYKARVFRCDGPPTWRRRSMGSGGESSSMLTSMEGNAVQGKMLLQLNLRRLLALKANE